MAELGFFVLAPDLFWRQEPNVDITDKSQEEWNKAFALMNGFDHEKGMADLKATLAAARRLPGANGKAGTMGYCLGGMLAFRMAMESDADVNVSYYGVALDKFIGGARQGDRPRWSCTSPTRTSSSRPRGAPRWSPPPRATRSISAYVYPGANHAFARVGGVHWDARSAWIANGRSAEALAAALDG